MTVLAEPTHSDTARSRIAGGLYVPIVTPFGEDDALDVGAFEAVLDYLLDGGVDGLVVAGTTGEAHALSLDEREQLFRAAVRRAGTKVPIVAGAGATTTREARRIMERAAACGCDAALVLTPWFERPSAEAIRAYYAALADGAPLPMLLYHNPSRTGACWPAEEVGRVARELAGAVAGLKDSLNDARRVAEIRAAVPSGFTIFSGGPHEREAFFAAGADGSIDGPANALPREAAEAYAGDAAKAAYLAQAGEVFAASRNFIGLLKASMRAMGLPAGFPRRPHRDVDPEEYARLAAALRKGGRMAAGDAGRPTDCIEPRGEPLALVPANFEAECRKAPPLAAETRMLWRGDEATFAYNCHPAICRHGEHFFAAWSNNRRNEDSPAQAVRFCHSVDGKTWSAPECATPPHRGMRRWTCGGFWPREDGLFLLAVRYDRARYVDGEAAPGMCWENMATEAFRWDGARWQPQGVLVEDFYANEAPRQLPDGRWMFTGVNGLHDAQLAISADAQGKAWKRVTLFQRASGGGIVKLTEPTWFVARDGRLRALLRDDGGSRRLWLSESFDGAATWSAPKPTNFPDAQAKFHALALPDGRIALLCNPTSDALRRRLLAVAFSEDGLTFPHARILRFDESAAPRIAGMHKSRGFNYPNACVHDGCLWAIDSINKEDIEVHAVELGA